MNTKLAFSVCFILLASCNRPSTAPTAKSDPNQLTRELAEKLISPKYPRTVDFASGGVCMTKQGMQRAMQDGIVASGQGNFGAPGFTEKGKQLVDAISGWQYTNSYTNRNDELCCDLREGVQESFGSITGIAMGPLPNTATIEFTTQYTSGAGAFEKLRPYIYAGNTKNAHAQLYDDGWRLVQE